MRQEEQQVSNDHPEAVRSAPVPVPPAGDRTSHSDVPEDTLDDRDTFDDQAVAGEQTTGTERDAAYDPADDEPAGDSDPRHRRDDRSADEGGFNEPGPLPTTFGATTVADAVAASALASPRPQDQPDPRAERTAQPGDGAEDGEREGLRADPTAELHRRDAAPGTDPDAVAAGAAGYGSATPEMVDPDADGEPVTPDGDDTSLGAAGTSRPTGSTVAAEPATLLDTDTAQGFRDRWRDVQLRFVDDPHAAAGEAQSLVEEAIQALASALAAQKNTLGGWQDAGSADTEQLRVAVRRYRDFLDRVLGR
ncbi:hypothetical protein C7C45_00385 [Micromonospora arborensis]|uniref:Uncharacterized protein n=2 Tax=Micromonospora arborensis TaxID=2116518 RepID=A0A318NSY6_9ACTN|nr:hypothetical protein [Micromonospora arborensis]PYC76486.1 hypothetical protein C7C45_00385 [Micromonospora arborensis]